VDQFIEMLLEAAAASRRNAEQQRPPQKPKAPHQVAKSPSPSAGPVQTVSVEASVFVDRRDSRPLDPEILFGDRASLLRAFVVGEVLRPPLALRPRDME
jgi:hypothetical protein